VSPYAPVSRLFWSELYVDPRAAPEFAGSADANELLRAANRHSARAAPDGLIDYASTIDARRPVFERLLDDVLASTERRAQLEAFCASWPAVIEYAAFRATWERRGQAWRAWPDGGRVDNPDDRSQTQWLYRYLQFLATQQIENVAARAAAAGVGLYLDLPVGVHVDGYDTWRFRGMFAEGASVGAPPDQLFSAGQDWGFQPPVPRAMTEDGHRYFAAMLRHHMRFASYLRIDHVMGLHRLYWIPQGASPVDGVYVRYPFEELYAVMALESHRAETQVTGENLGTVPGAVNSAMRRHSVSGLYVAQFEVADRDEAIRTPEPTEVASLNTHDIVPFAAWWHGDDLNLLKGLGLLDDSRPGERERRRIKRALRRYLRRRRFLAPGDEDPDAMLAAVLRYLAASSAALLLVNLEDLWLERRPQNVPGTSTEMPNWRRPATHTLDEIDRLPGVAALLADMTRLRAEEAVGSVGHDGRH
jgi:4-alpha-glucanotransferase